MNNEGLRESVSALADGELAPAQARRTLDALLDDPELRALWRRQHLVGAVLAGQREPVAGGDDLAERVRAALDAEPTVLPVRRGVTWRLPGALAVAASAAVLAVLVAFGLAGEPERAAAPAISAADPLPAAPLAVATRDPAPADATPSAATTRMTWNDAGPGVEARLNGYLLNHNEYLAGGVRGMLPYARVVGYDGRN